MILLLVNNYMHVKKIVIKCIEEKEDVMGNFVLCAVGEVHQYLLNYMDF